MSNVSGQPLAVDAALLRLAGVADRDDGHEQVEDRVERDERDRADPVA